MTATRIPVLMYHRIGDPSTDWDSHYSVTPRNFTQQMGKLARKGYRACSLGEFLSWLDQSKPLPEKTVLITFDDGFCGVHDHAAPVLRELNWPYTVFMVSDKLGQPADWSTHDLADRSRQLMNRGELEGLLSAGASIQSHSASHVDLTGLPDQDLEREIVRSRESLAALTGQAVLAIAYPYGRHDERVTKLARSAGYRVGFSVIPGFNRPQTDRLSLRRLDVFGTDSAAQLLRKLEFGSNDGSISQEIHYLARRIAQRLNGLAGRSTS